MAARPDLALINKAAAEAVNLFPESVTVRENYNEFAKVFVESGMKLIDDRPADGGHHEGPAGGDDEAHSAEVVADDASNRASHGRVASERPAIAAPRVRSSGGERLFAYALLAPAVVAVFALIAYPMYLIFAMSFREGKSLNFLALNTRPFGLGNYADRC